MASDTIVGRDLTSDELVPLSFQSRTNGLYVIGKQGRGKTNFLLHLIIQDLYHKHGLCVLDPHGDLIVDVLGCIPSDREDDVVLLDLQDINHLFAYDVFAGADPIDVASLKSAEERIVGMFKKVWGGTSWGPRLEDLLGNSVHVMLRNPGTTLADLPAFLTDPRYRQQLLGRATNPHVLNFFAHEYDPVSVAGQRAIYAPLMNKLRAFLRDAALGEMVSTSGATVDFHQILARNQILLIRLNSEWEEATSLLGIAIVLQLFQAALGRKKVAPHRRPPFALYADEFQLFATPTFGHLFQQVRKYNVATTIAHQLRSQLSDDLQDAAKGAVNIVTFQTMTDDAGEMAREYQSRGTSLPRNLTRWAEQHSDSQIRTAMAELKFACLGVEIRYEAEAPSLSYLATLDFVERRLHQAVREGNRRATPFPSQYWYGVYDLEVGSYGRLTEAFGILRDRLLLPRSIDAADLAQLPMGQAAAKLEQRDRTMYQGMLTFPLAISSDRSLVVKTIFDHEGSQPEAWPEELSPSDVAAGLRARRIRERNRQRFGLTRSPEPPEAANGHRPEEPPPPAPPSPATPIHFEVDLD